MIRKATKDDTRVLAEMAVQMWSSHTVDELEAGFVEALNNETVAIFIKSWLSSRFFLFIAKSILQKKQ